MRQKAKQILLKTDIDKLPSLPHCLLSLLDMVNSETLPLERMATLLRYDPALRMRVYASMNHAGINYCDASLIETLARFDRNRLQAIATNAATHQFFSRINIERTEFIKQHWYRSILCAHIAEAIATEIEYIKPDEAYTAGLLHDIGQLILEAAFPNQYITSFTQLSKDKQLYNLEQEEFKTTHYEVGSECLRKHGCDAFIADAVLYQHEQASSLLDAHHLAKIIHVANLMSDERFEENGDAVTQSANSLLGINKRTLQRILKQCKQAVHQIAESLEIEIPKDDIDGDTAKQIISREQNKQLLLAEQVRNIALLDSVNQTVARNTNSDLGSITREQCQLLFGIGDCVLFLYDIRDDCVIAHTQTNHSHVNDLAIPLENGRSLVTDALINKENQFSFDHKYTSLTVIDRQLIDLYNKQGMMCLPLILDNHPVGCIAMAIDEIQQAFLVKQSTLLRQFANTLASSLQKSGHASSADGKHYAGNEQLDLRIREIAHEVRNPLSIINNYLEILSFKLESENPAQEEIRTIKSEIERIGTIINRLTTPEKAAEQHGEVDLNSLISQLSRMFQSSLLADRRVTLELDLEDQLSPIISNSNLIRQIYTNLIKNAAEAVPANGEIMVYTLDNVNVDGVTFVELGIVDNGPGIPADILPKLFTPVQTTKQGQHAGLGLTIVKNLVSELNGSIRCRSSENGTSFYVLLPRN